MHRSTVLLPSMVVAGATLVGGGTSLAQPVDQSTKSVVRFSLRSASSIPAVVAPGSTVQWQLVAEVSSDNLGLAGFFCAVIECDAFQPQAPVQTIGLLMQPGASPPTNVANFAPPLGIANPPDPAVPGSGYGGGQFIFINGFFDAVGLLEIGGMQNTLGVALPSGSPGGQSSTVVLGVGQQSGGEVVATGSFTIPARSTLPPDPLFDLPWSLELCIPFQDTAPSDLLNFLGIIGGENFAQANVITAVGGAGQPSSVEPARVDFGPKLQFIVLCLADFNQDNMVSVQDIFDFLAAWFAWTSGTTGGTSPDINHDGQVTVQDIFDFLALWFVGCG